MAIAYIDVETSTGIHRLRPGAENLYVLWIPSDTSPEAAREIRQRLDVALRQMSDPPQVIVSSDDIRLEDVTAQIAGGRAS